MHVPHGPLTLRTLTCQGIEHLIFILPGQWSDSFQESLMFISRISHSRRREHGSILIKHLSSTPTAWINRYPRWRSQQCLPSPAHSLWSIEDCPLCSKWHQALAKSSWPRIRAVYNASVVIVRVGPNAQPFHIHKDLLCCWSKYFHNAFNGSFREANEKEMTILDVQPSIFKIFIGWLYTQILMLDKDIEDTLTPGDCHNVQSDETPVDGSCQNEEPLLCLRSVKETDIESCNRIMGNCMLLIIIELFKHYWRISSQISL